MQLSIDFFATRLTEDDLKGFEDSNATYSEDWKEISLCKHLRSLTNQEVLARYEDFLERNADSPSALRGYRLLRAEAYRRRLFDAIDAIDREKGRSDNATASTD